MASAPLTVCSGLAGVARPGRYGARSEEVPAAVLAERTGLGIAHVAARQGKVSEVVTVLAALAGATPEDGPRCVAGNGMAIVGCAPAQWLVTVEGSHGLTAARLADALAGIASVIDHASGKVVVRVSGARARDVLAKGCPVDLHARAFGPGAAAATEIAHMGCLVWQVDDRPTFDLAVNRSLSKSFWSWLAASAAEYGYEVA